MMIINLVRYIMTAKCWDSDSTPLSLTSLALCFLPLFFNYIFFVFWLETRGIGGK